MSGHRSPVVVILVVAVITSVVGVTLALWAVASHQPVGAITNGQLQMVADTPFSWQETTPAKASNLASGTDLTSLANFIGTSGDEVELRYHVTTTLTGDNLQAKLTATWSGTAPTLPSGLSVAGYRIYDSTATSQLIATTALGVQSQPLALTSTGASGTVAPQFVIAVVVRWTSAATPTYTTDLTGTTSSSSLTELPLSLSLVQVR